MEIVVFIIMVYVVSALMPIAGVAYILWDLCVKRPRRVMWCEQHPGELLGDDYFQKWCYENGIKPSYYL